MKVSVTNKTIVTGVCLLSLLFMGCPSNAPDVNNSNIIPQNLIEAETMKEGTESFSFNTGIENVKIPAWKKSSKGYSNIPAVITDENKSNVNEILKAGVKNNRIEHSAKNLILMCFENLTEGLVQSAEQKYGELIINEVPLKMTVTAPLENDNTDRENNIDNYLRDVCMKNSAYATTSVISNSFFRRVITTCPSTEAEDDVVEKIFLSRPCSIIMARDTASGKIKYEMSLASQNYTNEVYKSNALYAPDFKNAVAAYGSDSVFIQGMNSSHPDKNVTAKSIYNVIPQSAEEFPSIVQMTQYGLTWLQSKETDDGFFFVVYEEAVSGNNEADLKSFDEGVAVACKYVLENPDTILVVTSAAVDGSNVPAYVFGTEENSESETLLEFIKNTFQEM